MSIPVKMLYSDNESEFLYADIQRICRDNGVETSRFVPYKKNDSEYVERKRVGRKIRKRYDIGTPLSRVLRLEEVKDEKKKELIKLRAKINILALSREIERLQDELYRAYRKKLRRRGIRYA